MAAIQRKLVHKQFNSPMGLYSEQNVKETLDRELKAFGIDGIEVGGEVSKPLNLANSAVLRAVEEEEQMKCGYKRVAWPPVSEERVAREFTPQPANSHYPVSGQQQQQQSQQLQQQQPLQHQQQQPGAAPNSQFRATSYEQYQQQPPYCQPHQGAQPLYSQQTNQQLQQQHYPNQQQQQQQPLWARNPATQKYPPQEQQQQYQASPPSNYQSQPYHQQQYQALPQQQQYSSVPQSNPYNSYSQPQQQHVGQDQPDRQSLAQQQQAQSLPQDYRGGSPGIITLRKEAPVSQKPAPVYNSQPAAVSFRGGSNMRGDLKWPPPEYKEAALRENEERRQLALGPVCRPRRVNRDYTTFFAKNALNSYYPSYKVPPGTQHMLA